MSVGHKIGELIKQSNESIAEVAEKVNMNYMQLYMFIKSDGERIRLIDILKIANLYKVPLFYFLEDNEVKELKELGIIGETEDIVMRFTDVYEKFLRNIGENGLKQLDEIFPEPSKILPYGKKEIYDLLEGYDSEDCESFLDVLDKVLYDDKIIKEIEKINSVVTVNKKEDEEISKNLSTNSGMSTNSSEEIENELDEIDEIEEKRKYLIKLLGSDTGKILSSISSSNNRYGSEVLK